MLLTAIDMFICVYVSPVSEDRMASDSYVNNKTDIYSIIELPITIDLDQGDTILA